MQARKFGKLTLFQMTGGHKGWRCVVERNVACVVLKKMVIAD